MKKIILAILILKCTLGISQEIVYPENWKTNYHWDSKYEFLATGRIEIGKINGRNFAIRFGKNEYENKYYAILELIGGENYWTFKNDVKFISGLGSQIICIERGLNSNMIIDEVRKIASLYFLTEKEFKEITEYGLRNISFSMDFGDKKDTYSFGKIRIEFETRSKVEIIGERKEEFKNNGIELFCTSGKIDRKIRVLPKTINTQERGKISIKIRVDYEGNVIEVEWDKRNSTIGSGDLVLRCKRNAMEYKFEKIEKSEKEEEKTEKVEKPQEPRTEKERIADLFSSNKGDRKIEDEYCWGTITYNFKVKMN